MLKHWWTHWVNRWPELRGAWQSEQSNRSWFGLQLFLRGSPPPINDTLWQAVLARYDFLSALSVADKAHLKTLAAHFLANKEFSGAHGLQITDEMALCIAAQACLPILHIAPRHRPRQALAWYADFVGIVIHPGRMRARRSAVDEAGVAHYWSEDISGEAMDGGPLTLSWQDAAGKIAAADNQANSDCAMVVSQSGSIESKQTPYNVVIHEFAHIMDMHSGAANGCPTLPNHFCGIASRAQAARHWQSTLAQAFEALQEAVSLHERFGAPAPLLDAYASTNPAEFFAVAAEGYFTQRSAFAVAHPALLALFDRFFSPTQ